MIFSDTEHAGENKTDHIHRPQFRGNYHRSGDRAISTVVPTANSILQALVKAKENDQVHGTLFESVCATIFFGTPHRGILVDDILAMVGEDSPRLDLVNSIALGSDALKTELVKFIHCSSSMRIVSFYETTQTRKLAKVRPLLTPANIQR